MTALVTGAAGGIGRAIVTKLRAEGFDVKELDLVSGFDVTDPEAWEHIGSVDLACLNAGVLTGSDDIAALTDEQYRRAVGVNVDGVMRTLMTRGLVEEAGHDGEGGSTLYRTTTYFLERLGLRDVSELPDLAPFLPELDSVDDYTSSGSGSA